jgi:hypothetical protein
MDYISWREVKEDNQCWSHKGQYLGRCMQIGTTGAIHDPDPFFRFQETGNKVFQGIDLKFTKVPCQDRKTLLALHNLLSNHGKSSNTGVENILGDDLKVKELAQFMDPLPPLPPPSAAAITSSYAAALPQPPLETSNTFTPIVLNNSSGQKIYECPICHNKTGTLIPQNPEKYAYTFPHNYTCQNKNKVPREEPTGGRKYKKKLLKRKRYSKKINTQNLRNQRHQRSTIKNKFFN